MKKKILFGIVIALILCCAVSAFANSAYEMTYYPGTVIDTVTNMPPTDPGTGGEPYTVSPLIPERAGYEFIDWELDYGIGYKVTYVVNPDPTYGTPEGSEVPTDPTVYWPNGYVKVHDQLTTEVNYAYNEKGEKVKGSWEFVTWDKADFEITEDTTITGGWVFKAAPATKYNYVVEYWLVDGTKRVAKVAADKHDTVDALGTPVIEDAIPMGSRDLYARYRSPSKYRIMHGWERVKATINKDGYVIYIYYEEIPHGQ